MADQHNFIFQPGNWVGEGIVTFSASSEELPFVTKWQIGTAAEREIEGSQEVQMEASEEPVNNQFQFFDITASSFKVSLHNEILGQVVGSGIIDEQTIAWEFRGTIGFQGYEVYERQSDGEYTFHAEYASPDQFRTIIDGRIRRGQG